MEIQILGPLRVWRDGVEVELGPFKQRVLLALLAVHAGRVVTTDRILEELWGDDAFGKEQALWVYISRLRSALQPDRDARGASDVLLTRDHGYLLDLDSECVDAVRAERLIEAARSRLVDAPLAAATELERALAAWRGGTLEEFAFHDFARHAIARYEELRAGAAEDRFEALLRTGAHGRIVAELDEFQRQHPLRERPVALLMLATYRNGQHVESLRSFERFRKHLTEELGVVPSPELRRLEEQILLHDERLQPPARATLIGPRSVAANPFKGLHAFDEGDAAVFFGREQLVAEVIRKITGGERLITLVGPSGSGKSSVLGAGVVTALRKDALAGSSSWAVARMVPGAHPFAELEAAMLRSVIDPPASVSVALADEEYGVLRAALALVSPDQKRIVIIVDQLEELFTTTDPAPRDRFLRSLVNVITDPRGRILVLAAVRADFYDRLLDHEPFAARLTAGQVNVLPLRPDQLEQAMQGPLDETAVGFDRALMATLVGDVLGRPAALPLYQFTLTELFDKRRNDTLTLDDYRAMGGISGVIGNTAERLYDAFDEAQRDALRAVLLRLVSIEEGGQRVRRRVEAAELLSLGLDVEPLQRVIDDLGRHRLLTFDRSSTTGAPTVEIAHEALLAEWARLRTWIDEAHDDIRRRMALDLAVAEWTEHDRDPEFLLTGGRLAEYERWAPASSIQLDETEREFLQRAITVRDDRDQATEDRDRQFVDLSRRARRRSWALAVVLLLVVAVVGGLVVAREVRATPTKVAVVAYPRNGAGGVIDQVANGVAQVERLDDVEVVTLHPLSDLAGETEALLESEPQLTVIGGVEASEAALDVVALAADHPDVHFVVLDAGRPTADAANITDVTIAPAEGSFLAGAAAALMSTTGTIGFVGAHPGIGEPFRAGYEAGARTVDRDVHVLSTYPVAESPFAGFEDVDLIGAAARDLYRQGADVVFHASGVAGRAIASVAAEESARAGQQRWFIGVDVDEWALVDPATRPYVLTSMLKRHDLGLVSVVERFRDGTLEAGDVALTLADGAMALSRSGRHIDETTWRVLEDLRDAVASGAIVVPLLPAEGPTGVDAADVTGDVTFDGTTCVATAGAVANGETLRLDVRNTSESVARVSLAIASGDGPPSPRPENVYTYVDVAAGGSQVLTVRAIPGRLAVLCGGAGEALVAGEISVTGGFVQFTQPDGWFAPFPPGELGFYFEPVAGRTDAVYLMAGLMPDRWAPDCELAGGDPAPAAELVAWLHTIQGVDVTDQPGRTLGGFPASVVDVADRPGAPEQCAELDQVPLLVDQQDHATQVRDGESVRFFIVDLPPSAPVRTLLVAVHASEGGDLERLVELADPFLDAIRFAS